MFEDSKIFAIIGVRIFTDIIVGNRIQTKKYPIHEPSIIYENINGKLFNNTYNISPDFENVGIINKIMLIKHIKIDQILVVWKYLMEVKI